MTNSLQRSHDTPIYAPYQLMLPTDIGEMIETSDSVNTVLKLTERLDYNLLNASYKRIPSASEASPKQMFQLIILGYMKILTQPEN